MGMRVITPPTVEVVSLAEARAHLRIDADNTADDSMISLYITAAREECEHLLERSIGSQVLRLYMDAWPEAEIPLEMPPVTSIVWIRYIVPDEVEQTVPSANYGIDNSQLTHWVLPASGEDWPEAADVANAVQVQYNAGYSPEECPALIKQWILLRVGSLYNQREADSDRPPVPVDFTERLLDRYRIPSY